VKFVFFFDFQISSIIMKYFIATGLLFPPLARPAANGSTALCHQKWGGGACVIFSVVYFPSEFILSSIILCISLSPRPLLSAPSFVNFHFIFYVSISLIPIHRFCVESSPLCPVGCPEQLTRQLATRDDAVAGPHRDSQYSMAGGGGVFAEVYKSADRV